MEPSRPSTPTAPEHARGLLRRPASDGQVVKLSPRGRALLRQIRGRGAVSNPQGRFEFDLRARVDDGWYQDPEDEQGPPRTQVTFEQARSVLTRNDSPDIFFNVSINPYRGCEHGCVYCYARPGHSYLGMSPGLDFETRLVAKGNAAERLREELASPSYRCEPVNIGSATDCYQPIEREYGITRSIIEVFAQCDHPITLITKSSLVERDLDLLAPMARKGLVTIFITVTTLDPGLAQAWEPRAPAPWRRLRTIERLSEAGIPVGVCMAPIVPFVNEPEIEKVLEAARDAGARSAHYVMLRLPNELKQVFSEWLTAWNPERAPRVLQRLQDMRGAGKLNDARFFSRMRGEGAWAELVHMRFQMASRKLGLGRDRLPLRSDLFVAPGQTNQLGLF